MTNHETEQVVMLTNDVMIEGYIRESDCGDVWVVVRSNELGRIKVPVSSICYIRDAIESNKK